MTDNFLSLDEVASVLGLHVRTVRSYVRQGKIKASRIGKQYRVARADLDHFTGSGHAASQHAAGRQRSSEVMSVVQIDAVDPALANRITTMLIAACSASKDDPGKQVSCRYLPSLGRLKLIISGNIQSAVDLTQVIKVLLEQ